MVLDTSIGVLIGVGITLLILKYYVPGYLAEKGKNLATKEDVEEITKKVESVRTEHALLLEAVKSRNQMKFAAIDKRLETHQRAFALWRDLYGKIHNPKVIDVVNECHEFWNTHCLYLEPEVREAFALAYQSAARHKDLIEQYRGMGGEGRDEIEENMRIIRAPRDLIAKAVELPPFSDEEVASNEENA